MGLFHHKSEQAAAYDEVHAAPHKASLSHELMVSAAAYAAAKAWENHNAKKGKPDSHPMAKELFAGAVGAFVDHMVETKGLNFLDKERVKHHAGKLVEQALANASHH